MPSTPEPASLPAEIEPDASRDDAKQPASWLAKNLRWLGALCIANVVLLIVLIGGPALRQHYVLEALRSSDIEFRTHEIGPKWLRDWVGPDRMQAFETIYIIIANQASIPIIIENRPLFDAVESIFIEDAVPSAESLKLLLGDPAQEPVFQNLRAIFASCPALTDEHLVCFAHCRSLTYLYLPDTHTTGKGLRHLSDLTSMRQLILDKNEIEGGDIQHLSRMTDLVHFTVGCDEGGRQRSRRHRQAAESEIAGTLWNECHRRRRCRTGVVVTFGILESE